METEKRFSKKGFTLLELLIVVAILAILAAVALFVLNPAETLRETRDSQRVSDLATLKTALALYITKTTSPLLDNGTNANCKNGASPLLFYSYPSDSPGTPITDATLDTFTAVSQVAAASSSLVNGTGWVKVNLAGLTGGSPVSAMPVDPTNTITAVANVAYSDLVYRYACDATDLSFELNARLESQAMTTKMARDGGNSSNLYENGTKLTILGGSANEF